MTKNKLALATVLCTSLLLSTLGACTAAESGSGQPAADQAAIAAYNTQLFSLLMNKKSPVDGKNHYQKDFDLAFDALLAKSTLAKSAKPAVPLKKRLISGPQPDPTIVQDQHSGRQYVYYEACQAHACDETNLALLYAPSSKTMLARLHLDGKDEYLGDPSPAEKTLLDHSKNTP
ncbi:hypothetical protein RugamoR57_32570 [Duganella caerulea]|uniref:hypothetical protein n=1 Tax=Duganella caerulea TaxID=2885762 RepID=UPI0030EA4E5C